MSGQRLLVIFGSNVALVACSYHLLRGSTWGSAIAAGIVLGTVATIVAARNRPSEPPPPAPPAPREPPKPWAPDPDVVWPYQPRAGYPSVPVWLLCAILAGSIVGLLWFFALIGG